MLEDRRTRFALISRAPLEKLNAWKEKQGWSHTWVSSAESDFNYDFHATLDRTVVPLSYNFKSAEDMQAPGTAGATYQGEAHGLSVFFRIGEDVFHTYSVYARGVERLTDAKQAAEQELKVSSERRQDAQVEYERVDTDAVPN